MGPGPFTKTGHFILLIGMTEEGRITLNDPNSKKKSRKSWEVSEVTDSMRKAWTVKKPAR